MARWRLTRGALQQGALQVWRDLDRPTAWRRARVLVPFLFGCYAVWLGADFNWDETNYHLYNPFAWINGKLFIDLAPAGLQSYFNPLLDVPLFELKTHLAPPLVGFAMGALHGVMFLLLFQIARLVFATGTTPAGGRLALLLAASGCLTANFLSELSNSMGDNTTALLVVAGVWLLLRQWGELGARARGLPWGALVGGLLFGAAAGLKLTNATYAVAGLVALCRHPSAPRLRIRIVLNFAVGVVLGFAATGGYWMFKLWVLFGNPLYPQFSRLFPSPLTAPVGASDTRWGPHGPFESVLWPFLISLHPSRIGEVPIHQAIWPLLYLACVACVVSLAWMKLARRPKPVIDARQQFVVWFVVAGFLVWTAVFNVGRYLVPVEVLAPVALMICLRAMRGQASADRLSGVALVAAAALVVLGGARTWGHEPWADPLVRAGLPELGVPSKITVITASPANSWAWLATLYPVEVSFVGLGRGFPESAAFRIRIHQMVEERGGAAFAIIDGFTDKRQESIAAANVWLHRLHLANDPKSCARLRWLANHATGHSMVVDDEQGQGRDHPQACQLMVPPGEAKDAVAENRALAAREYGIYHDAGFLLDPARCMPYPAFLGQTKRTYQWCVLTTLSAREPASA